jgi:hypothetical protein
MRIAQLKDKALKTFRSLALYIPAFVCFVLAGVIIVEPALSLLCVVLFIAMTGGILFSVARKVNNFRKEIDTAVDTITTSLNSKQSNLSYKQFRTAGPSANNQALNTINNIKNAGGTIITEGITSHLSLTPQELEELKKKVTIH